MSTSEDIERSAAPHLLLDARAEDRTLKVELLREPNH
jgi:hypothetical protein